SAQAAPALRTWRAARPTARPRPRDPPGPPGRRAPPSRHACSRAHETTNRGRDALGLLVGELGVHREREDLVRHALGHWEIALAVAQELGRLLQVDRHRVVDLRADALRAEILAHRVALAPRHADRVGVEHVAVPGRDLRRDDAGASEELVVLARERA